MIRFTQNVGVAPGTTTMRLGRGLGRSYWNPYTDIIALNGEEPQLLRDRAIRWDLVGVVGGASLMFALTLSTIASALRR